VDAAGVLATTVTGQLYLCDCARAMVPV